MPLLAEAMRAYEEGLGTAEDIDTGAKVGLNHPMGPLELADFIGLDVCLGIMQRAPRGLRRTAVRAAAGPGGAGRGRATWARRRAAGSTPTRAESRPTTVALRRGSQRERGVHSADGRVARAQRPRLSSSPRHARRSASSAGALAGVPGGGARRHGDPRRRGARRPAGRRPDRRGRSWARCSRRAPARRPRARRSSGPGLADTTPATTINRVCGSGLKAIMFAAAGDPGGRRRPVRRGRHGVDEPGAVPAAQGALRLPAGPGGARRLGGPRRPVVRHRRLPHGHPRRAGRDPGRGHPRGPGRVRAREPPAGGRGQDAGRFDDEMAPGHDPRREGPRDGGHGGRGPAARHDRRGARPAGARLRRCPRARTAARRRRAPSRPATRPGSPTGPRRRSSRPSGRWSGTASRRSPGSSGYAQAEVDAASGCSSRPIEGVRALGATHRPRARGLRPGRGQRGVRRPGARRRPRAGLRLVEGQRERRRDRPGPPDRRVAARGSSPRCSTSCAAGAADTGWRRSAWAAAARSRWRSSGCSEPLSAREPCWRSATPPVAVQTNESGRNTAEGGTREDVEHERRDHQ